MLATAVACSVSCGDDADRGSATPNDYDDDFGHEAQPFDRDTGALSMDSGLTDGGDLGEVFVRFVHSMVNVDRLYVCHDPDLVLDDPRTAANEEIAGPAVAMVLPLESGFGATDAVALPALSNGILTVHVRPALGSTDGGTPFDADAGVAEDGGVLDAGAPQPSECSAATRVAAWPLSPEISSGKPALDAGTESAKSSLTNGPLLLIASGLALDEERLKLRAREAHDLYLAMVPGDEAGADQAGRLEVATLQETFGPQLRIERDSSSAVPMDSFRLSLTQLMPDVQSGVHDRMGPGSIRICVTVDTLENPVEPPPEALPIPFRNQVPLTPDFKPGKKYVFRVFPAAKFDPQPPMAGNVTPVGQDCETTGLTPLAPPLVVEQQDLLAGQSYNLLLTGAVAPSPLCAPVDARSVVRPGCALNPSELGARLILLK